MSDLLTRASEVEDFTGRTLEGIAYRYERPSRVSDDAYRTTYFEEIMKRADAKTLAEHDEFPLLRLHNRAEDAIGTVTFHHSDAEDALLFRALVAHSRHGDEVLADEGWRDVSVGYKPIRDTYRTTEHHGRITQRRELRLVELSVAPTGTGQTKGAEILTVRAAVHGTPLLDHYRRKRTLLL